MYTFVVISYNEEKYIFETLESIRFQIDTYGDNRTYQLVIADDCSQDQTQEYIDYWLECYAYLFESVSKIYQPNNVGSCINLVNAMQTVQGSLFFLTAGDDMLAHTDIFTVLEQNNDVDVLTSATLITVNGQILDCKRKYQDILAQALHSTKYVKWSVGLGCPIQVGAVWNHNLNTETIYGYMKKLDILEDRPRYYAIWHQNASIAYKYVNTPLLLYRRNNSSASALNGKHLSRLNQDLIKYYRMVKEESSSFWYCLCVSFQIQSVKLRGRGKWSFIRFFTPYYIAEEFKRLIHHVYLKSLYAEVKNKYIEINQRHCLYLHKESERLKKTYENRNVSISAARR
ncbi:MAG: glycosyltransferase family 2 protein [Lachnospiraceae bacterium]|nr:glycosyltransferase family 2 protein [Lachnospiraceae bacterium]